MIEHAPWIGRQYGQLFSCQRVVIAGWSFHRGEEDDYEDWTRETIEMLIKDQWPQKYLRARLFYDRICNYFSFEDHPTFWPNVAFFNFLPSCVPDDDRYSHGDMEQHRRGRERFLQLLRCLHPTKVFVFTSRHWAFPCPSSPGFQNLGDKFPRFCWATYPVGHPVKVVFLRHPQGARRELMRAAVQRGLEI